MEDSRQQEGERQAAAEAPRPQEEQAGKKGEKGQATPTAAATRERREHKKPKEMYAPPQKEVHEFTIKAVGAHEGFQPCFPTQTSFFLRFDFFFTVLDSLHLPGLYG